VSGDERLRLFCALRLPSNAVERLVSWQLAHLPGGRIVPPENLHLTLAFLGHRPAGDVPAVVSALESAAARERGRIALRVRGYCETRNVGMLTLDDEGGRAADLAERLHELLESAGVYRHEARAWLPHLTVLRFRDRPRLRPPLPELGEVAPSGAAVFISRLRPGGARYEVLEIVSLGGR
jgi:RNA 2',3'-cyclic 3'-phosphodiesterase